MMTHARHCCLLSILGICCFMVAGSVRAGDADAPTAETLIARLAADNFRDRQDAEAQLAAMGSSIRPAIERALADATDLELRTRLGAILRGIKDRDATGQSLITLHLQDARARDAFDALWNQCGGSLRTQPPDLFEAGNSPKAKIDIDGKPFWAAIRILCQTYGLQLQSSTSGERDIVIVDGRSAPNPLVGKAPWVVEGPFVVMAQTITRNQWMDLNQGRNINRYCNIQFVVLAEPKLRVLRGTYMANLEEVVDGNGNSLIPPGARTESVQTMPGWTWNLQAALRPAEIEGGRIATLRGSGAYWIQTRSEKVEFGDITTLKDVTRNLNGRSVTIKEVQKTDGVIQVRLAVDRAAWQGGDLQYLQAGNALRLLDADGQVLPRSGGTSTTIRGTSMELMFRFQQAVPGTEHAGEPARLIIELPTETRQITVPFEFTDLPLP